MLYFKNTNNFNKINENCINTSNLNTRKVREKLLELVLKSIIL